jgi:hypothetical protein
VSPLHPEARVARPGARGSRLSQTVAAPGTQSCTTRRPGRHPRVRHSETNRPLRPSGASPPTAHRRASGRLPRRNDRLPPVGMTGPVRSRSPGAPGLNLGSTIQTGPSRLEGRVDLSCGRSVQSLRCRLSTHSSRSTFARAAIQHWGSVAPHSGARMPGTIEYSITGSARPRAAAPTAGW